MKNDKDNIIEQFGNRIRNHNDPKDSFYIACNVDKIELDFQNYTGYCYVPYLNSWNFTDLIKSFKRIDKEINIIVCFEGNKERTKYSLESIYLKAHNEWLWQPDYIREYSQRDFNDRISHIRI